MKEEPYTDKRVSLTKKTIHAKDVKQTLPGEVKEKYKGHVAGAEWAPVLGFMHSSMEPCHIRHWELKTEDAKLSEAF